jgi:hypothetical protein
MSLHSFGIILSVIGLWLASAGLVGKKRLKHWEVKIRAWSRKPLGFPKKLYLWAVTFRDNSSVSAKTGSFLDSTVELLANILIWVYRFFLYGFILFVVIASFGKNQVSIFFAYIVAALAKTSTILIVSLGVVLSSFILIFILPLVLYIIANLIAVTLWVSLRPYYILDSLAVKVRLESTVTFIGLIISTVGLLIVS